MEKKTKLTITLALAVLVITLSLGAAISIAPNESGAQTAAPIQPEIELQIQPEIAAPIQPEIAPSIQQEIAAPIQPEIEEPQTTVTGVIHIYEGEPVQYIYSCLTDTPPTIDFTVTDLAGGRMDVNVDGTDRGHIYVGQSQTYYGDPKSIYVHIRLQGTETHGLYTINYH